MSGEIPILLQRNLDDVLGEADDFRRRAAVDDIFHADAIFYDPTGGVFRGRAAIHEIAGVIRARHPDFKYQPVAPAEVTGNSGRVRWVSGVPGRPPEYAGTDFIIARGGKIAAVYLYFDPL